MISPGSGTRLIFAIFRMQALQNFRCRQVHSLYFPPSRFSA